MDQRKLASHQSLADHPQQLGLKPRRAPHPFVAFAKGWDSALLSLAVRVAHHVNHHGAGKDQHVVLARSDLHSVGIAQREPLL
jgi:hypothetical protein